MTLLLLTFSRNPKEFREALLSRPDVAKRREAVAKRGLPVELPSGVKMLPRPDLYEPMSLANT